MKTVGINVGEAARDTERYCNRKAELYWGLRERFQAATSRARKSILPVVNTGRICLEPRKP